MRALIERADGSKVERARERMAAVREASRATAPPPELAADIRSEAEPEDI